ncbi:MAG: hypothetical protein KAT43_01980 [Nanoarchaeota archaeon]|nr:hypothetical protein [Nanoarchaeota archaeon]
MKHNIDFRKHLEDCLGNPPPEDPDKLVEREGFLALYKMACLLIEEGPKIEGGIEIDELAFYDLEEYIVPFMFNRGNYVGSIKFSADEPWQGVVMSWLMWLKGNIRPKHEDGERIIENNIDILTKAIENPEILNETPYPFLGEHQKFGQILLRYENDNFFMDYYYHFSSITDRSNFNLVAVRAMASFPGGGIIGIDKLKHEFRFVNERAEQITFDRILTIGDYNPLTKEQMIEIAKKKGIDYRDKSGLSLGQLWMPHKRVPLHTEEYFEQTRD